MSEHNCCKNIICCTCGKKLKRNELALDTDPYSEDIAGDMTLHRICNICRKESAMDI